VQQAKGTAPRAKRKGTLVFMSLSESDEFQPLEMAKPERYKESTEKGKEKTGSPQSMSEGRGNISRFPPGNLNELSHSSRRRKMCGPLRGITPAVRH